ncbi:hypothetical protein [Rhodococcus artemisiae]|uniref:Uncharacterized protein n=1 Tax=Rhodococcus artemisiae TaxID=714159 RepID=A0ABU7LCJ1_9NOCA|nr:hypothetical protein [Rhodococcus artemisiae]MEE2058987.1 hypothetical protein [Rhodococcus artemisiae]
MPTAEIVAEIPDVYAGPATLYRVDPPVDGSNHLIVYHQPPMYGQKGKVCVLVSDEYGVASDMRQRDGSYTTDEPNHHLALQLAGGYVLIESEATPALSPFNPADRTVAEVNDYLDHSDPAEQVRVLEAERNGKARKGILGEDVT